MALIALGLPLAFAFGDRVTDEVRSQAHSQAAIVATGASGLINPLNQPAMDRLTEIAARTVRGRVIIVDATGAVLSDSGDAGTEGRDYDSRPEIAAALRGESTQRERSSRTLETKVLATSDPIFTGDRVVGAVRITQSVDAVNSAVRRAQLGLALLAVLVLAFAMIVAAALADRISKPIRRLEASARRFATGGTETEAEVTGSKEQRSLARSFNEMTARVDRLLRSQNDFVANASHQLRTPLTGLRLRIEGLSDEAADPSNREELEAALREIDRLAVMVEELLILSRAGEIDRPGTDLDLAELAAAARDRWADAAGEHEIELTGIDRDDIEPVFGAPADLDRVLDVLLENAVNYSPAGSEIGIEVKPHRILITDRGAGVDPAEADLVFERFTRGRAGKQGNEGTGLGLAIARELASQWGATVTLGPGDGGATTATVEFSKADSR
ncbi:MAG: ATP-binding protein [Solirubrobacterales bacterium]|nr:ATP-binding protein [Solirubrobacterales bacterium]